MFLDERRDWFCVIGVHAIMSLYCTLDNRTQGRTDSSTAVSGCGSSLGRIQRRKSHFRLPKTRLSPCFGITAFPTLESQFHPELIFLSTSLDPHAFLLDCRAHQLFPATLFL